MKLQRIVLMIVLAVLLSSIISNDVVFADTLFGQIEKVGYGNEYITTADMQLKTYYVYRQNVGSDFSYLSVVSKESCEVLGTYGEDWVFVDSGGIRAVTISNGRILNDSPFGNTYTRSQYSYGRTYPTVSTGISTFENMGTVTHTNLPYDVYKVGSNGMVNFDDVALEGITDYSKEIDVDVSGRFRDIKVDWSAPVEINAVGIKISIYDATKEYGFEHLSEYSVEATSKQWIYNSTFDSYDNNAKYLFHIFFYKDGERVYDKTFDNITMGSFDPDEYIKDRFRISMTYDDVGMKITALQDMDLNYSVYEFSPTGGLVSGYKDASSYKSEGIVNLLKDEYISIPYKDIIPYGISQLDVYARAYKTDNNMSKIFSGLVNGKGEVTSNDDSEEQDIDITGVTDFERFTWNNAISDLNSFKSQAQSGITFITSLFSMLPYPFNTVQSIIVVGTIAVFLIRFVWS